MTGMRLSEPLGVLAMAADMLIARPVGASLTTAVVAAALAREAGQNTATQKAAYFAALFRFLGCTATAPEAGQYALGDDQGFSLAFLLCDCTDPDQLRQSWRQTVAQQLPEGLRMAALEATLAMSDQLPGLFQAHCDQAALFARRLPVPSDAIACLGHFHSRWDGLAGPSRAYDIPVAARIVSVAQVADLSRRMRGNQAMRDELQSRRGTHLDPDLASLMLDRADAIFAKLDDQSEFDAYVQAEPGEPIAITLAHCTALAETAADLVDQKSAWFAGHSRRVAALAADAGRTAGLDHASCVRLRNAGLLHDLGKCAISNRIWDKPGALSAAETLEMQRHAFQTDFLLAHAAPFTMQRPFAAAAYERADGSGYHRGIIQKGLAQNILAAANLWDELIRPNPTRPALKRKEATGLLNEAANSGRLSPPAVSAVLRAAGMGKRLSANALPAGLTRREGQVLARLGQSMTPDGIARDLGMATKTAETHIKKVYAKTGLRTRVQVALFALEHRIFPEVPLLQS